MYENMEEGCSLYRCSKRCRGFLTDREQRKVWGVGVLYILGFPILCCMAVIGALEVSRLKPTLLEVTQHSRPIHMESQTQIVQRNPTCPGSS